MQGLAVFLGFIAVLAVVCFMAWDRHSCKWKVLGASYTAPNAQWQTINGSAEAVVAFERRRNEGVTHVYLQCETCGSVREQDVYGHWHTGATLKDEELAQLRKMTGMES